MPKFTQIPTSTFEKLQINAGVLLRAFDAEKGVQEADMLGATTGGITFAAKPTYTDYGDDIDNCPKNMMELKKQESVEAKLSGTFVTIDTTSCRSLIGPADVVDGKVIPRADLITSDFETLHWVGDYGATDGSYIHIELKNALSTGGFQLKSTDKAKGQFAFEYTAHYSMGAQDEVPYTIEIVTVEAEG